MTIFSSVQQRLAVFMEQSRVQTGSSPMRVRWSFSIFPFNLIFPWWPLTEQEVLSELFIQLPSPRDLWRLLQALICPKALQALLCLWRETVMFWASPTGPTVTTLLSSPPKWMWFFRTLFNSPDLLVWFLTLLLGPLNFEWTPANPTVFILKQHAKCKQWREEEEEEKALQVGFLLKNEMNMGSKKKS